jgi:DNA-binding transcriptional LysR family regulator
MRKAHRSHFIVAFERHVTGYATFECMADSDLNLLTALDALLAEGSVVGAARRLHLSSSAMSRTLARLREATGDPLLVRAGRGLVRTPRATELRERVRDLVQDAQTVLRPAVASLDLAELKRSFTIRATRDL